MRLFDRDVYFDAVRQTLFNGSLTQQQVDGQGAILSMWEVFAWRIDLRWLAYMLATTLHETASTMWPIEEYGHGEGHEYGEPDPQTGQVYYGRGFVMITWRENYARADSELKLDDEDSCEWHANNALLPLTAARIMYQGMREGWFRSDAAGKQTLGRYFNLQADDPYGAREIINGDKTTVPDWSGGVSIGNLIAGYHVDFLSALNGALIPQRAA